MLFKVRTSDINLNIQFNAAKIVDNVMSAVRVTAERLTQDFKAKIITEIYSHVRRRTGGLEKAVIPFVLTTPSSVVLGFDFDLSTAPHLMTQIMMTRGESAYKTISARSRMLTVPLEDYVYGRKASSMNLQVIPTKDHTFLAMKSGSGGEFKPSFVLEHSVKVPKRIKMYDIMDEMERVAISEITKTAQNALNRSIGGM